MAVPRFDEFGFKDFILLENRVYLGGKIGDILTALQELRDDAKSMGSRSLVNYSEKIVNQIRRVLHTHWPKDELKFLKPLQKIGVAMMKAIEEREGLEEIISGSASELEKVLSKMGVPINKIGSNTSDDPEPEDKNTSSQEKNQPAGDAAPSTPDAAPSTPDAAPSGNPLDPSAGGAASSPAQPPPPPTGM